MKKMMNIIVFIVSISLNVQKSIGIDLSSTTEEVPATPDNNIALSEFQEYLRIDTTNSRNLDSAVAFWREKAHEVGLIFTVYEPAGLPIVVLTWPGTNTSLPSIMLNSHMDVVPADGVEDWEYPPFQGAMDDNRDIYGRGAQDDKDIAIQYLEAIRRLKLDNVTLQRTIHMTLMPDEETGGFNGMLVFVKTDYFQSLNVGFALDEGLPSGDDTLMVSYQDKRPWQMKFTVRGTGGHGSSLPEDVAANKILRLMTVITKYRHEQMEIAKSDSEYTSVNINMLMGGEVPNMIPETMSIVVDMRLSPSKTPQEANALVDSWIAEAGPGTTVDYIRHVEYSLATSVDDTNPYWRVFRESIETMGFKLKPIVIQGTTDMVPIRNMSIPAFGFCPKFNTVFKAHSTNEYLNADVFLKGIDVYVKLIENFGNLV